MPFQPFHIISLKIASRVYRGDGSNNALLRFGLNPVNVGLRLRDFVDRKSSIHNLTDDYFCFVLSLNISEFGN